MTWKQLTVLLLTAALLIVLFSLKTCKQETPVEVYEPKPIEYLEFSPYDSLFRVYADSICDWHLLAAIAYAETRFDTSKTSYSGAMGLMQIMPRTYRRSLERMGIDTDSVSVPLNIEVAAHQISRLDSMFRYIGMPERQYFILAGYNAGYGHVMDAMRITQKNGQNRYRWENVALALASLSREEVYTDSLCRNGRYNGERAVAYVNKVMRKYNEFVRMDLIYQAANRLGDAGSRQIQIIEDTTEYILE